MASLAVALCVDFTACSKDNDDLKRTKTIVVKTAGTLSTLIPAEEIEQITNLTLSGYINGDDVRFIQKMYNLTKADFTDLHIIGGGGTYETYPDYEYKYTRDNVFPCVFDSRQRDVLNEIKLPNSITGIEEGAFRYCANLTSIEIPHSVTSIEKAVFYGCTSLTSIEIPNGVTSIEEGTFCGCKSLTSIEIPNSVTSIEGGAFSGTSLTSIEIPNSVTSIGDDVFYGCTSLTSIEIPNGVTSIGNGAFDGCTSLTSIEIPNSVTSIGNGAFNDCTSLTSIEIPNSVTSIGEWAFWDAGLKKIHVKNSTPPKIMNNTFSTYAYVTLYVPVGSKENYTEHQIWRKFNIIEEQ